MDNETDLQKLRRVIDHTDRTYRLRPFETVVSYKLGDQLGYASLTLRTYEVTERTYGYRITKAGTKLVVWEPFKPVQTLTVWDTDTFDPIEVRDDQVTAKMRAEQRAWADMCYRPGSAKSPMDGPYAR